MHPQGCIFLVPIGSGGRGIGQFSEEFKREEARSVTIRPYRLDGISSHAGNPLELERRGRKFDFGPFVQLTKHIHLPFAAGTRAGPAQSLQGDECLRSIIPLNGQFLAYLLNINRTHFTV
jgi:hypothetical protein